MLQRQATRTYTIQPRYRVFQNPHHTTTSRIYAGLHTYPSPSERSLLTELHQQADSTHIYSIQRQAKSPLFCTVRLPLEECTAHCFEKQAESIDNYNIKRKAASTQTYNVIWVCPRQPSSLYYINKLTRLILSPTKPILSLSQSSKKRAIFTKAANT